MSVGQNVVASGQFLIDSEASLRGAFDNLAGSNETEDSNAKPDLMPMPSAQPESMPNSMPMPPVQPQSMPIPTRRRNPPTEGADMLSALIRWSIQNRFLVLMGTLLLTGWGVHATLSTPLDALPDLSDTQVIIRTEFPVRPRRWWRTRLPIR